MSITFTNYKKKDIFLLTKAYFIGQFVTQRRTRMIADNSGALSNILKRSGFREIRCISIFLLSHVEAMLRKIVKRTRNNKRNTTHTRKL